MHSICTITFTTCQSIWMFKTHPVSNSNKYWIFCYCLFYFHSLFSDSLWVVDSRFPPSKWRMIALLVLISIQRRLVCLIRKHFSRLFDTSIAHVFSFGLSGGIDEELQLLTKSRRIWKCSPSSELIITTYYSLSSGRKAAYPLQIFFVLFFVVVVYASILSLLISSVFVSGNLIQWASWFFL